MSGVSTTHRAPASPQADAGQTDAPEDEGQTNIQIDYIDEELEESMPASDPPALDSHNLDRSSHPRVGRKVADRIDSSERRLQFPGNPCDAGVSPTSEQAGGTPVPIKNRRRTGRHPRPIIPTSPKSPRVRARQRPATGFPAVRHLTQCAGDPGHGLTAAGPCRPSRGNGSLTGPGRTAWDRECLSRRNNTGEHRHESSRVPANRDGNGRPGAVGRRVTTSRGPPPRRRSGSG